MKKNNFVPVMSVQYDIRSLRIEAGMTQANAAERFNLSLRVWQMKESLSKPAQLSQGEYELLLLLAGKHPEYQLSSK